MLPATPLGAADGLGQVVASVSDGFTRVTLGDALGTELFEIACKGFNVVLLETPYRSRGGFLETAREFA